MVMERLILNKACDVVSWKYTEVDCITKRIQIMESLISHNNASQLEVTATSLVQRSVNTLSHGIDTMVQRSNLSYKIDKNRGASRSASFDERSAASDAAKTLVVLKLTKVKARRSSYEESITVKRTATAGSADAQNLLQISKKKPKKLVASTEIIGSKEQPVAPTSYAPEVRRDSEVNDLTLGGCELRFELPPLKAGDPPRGNLFSHIAITTLEINAYDDQHLDSVLDSIGDLLFDGTRLRTTRVKKLDVEEKRKTLYEHLKLKVGFKMQ